MINTSIVHNTLDLLILLPRLLSSSLRVYNAKRSANRFEESTRLLSPRWLADTLNIRPEHIVGARIEAIHSGTTSRDRLFIQYADGLDPLPGPRSLFIKRIPPDFASSLFGALFNLGGNEVAFYQSVRQQMTIESPKVYYAQGDAYDFLLLLEDLEGENCRFTDISSRCTLEEATQVLSCLARLHAIFWQSPTLDTQLNWLTSFANDPNRRLLRLIRRLCVSISFKKYPELIPDAIRELAPQLLDKYEQLEQLWAQTPTTLLHGDAHIGNMYFLQGQVGLLDWQVVRRGQGMRDVTYFLINSVPEDIRSEHQEQLITHYLEALQGHGISFDFEQAWRQYRLHSVYVWIAQIVTASSDSLQDRKIVKAGLSRTCKAIMELDAMALVLEMDT